MRKVVRSLGGKHTVLVSSHILSEVHETCDRILVLHEGRLVAQGSEEELSARLASSERVELSLRGDAEAIRTAALEALPELEIDDLEARGELVSLRACLPTAEEAGADPREVLVAALVHAGVGVRGVVERRTDLEGLFLSVVDEGQEVAS